ncbi:MAG TPA: class I SAM-dependent methyltransferase [Bryobacteraceae bacterium]|nr:class I SAM-dependent methyltransferase [Bryobacteraceae bacterium]
MTPAPILDLIEAFRRSKTMFAAVSLGIFDRLQEGPAEAHALGGNPDAMERLLDACVGLQLLKKCGCEYANTPLAEKYLCRSSPDTLRGYILYSDKVLYPMWGHLEEAVLEGTHRWHQTFGVDGALFSHFFKTPEATREFLNGMHGFGQISSPSIVAAFDLSRFRRMVDLGGATGHLALAAVERYPGLQAAVFDLPPVMPVAREFAAGRIEVIEGDFFSDPLPEADLFSLGRILHDWSEEKIRRLLVKIYDRLPAGGALLVVEKLLSEDKAGPIPAQMQSLNMLVVTEGKERTVTEYTALLKAAGFTEVEGRVTGTVLDAILAVKA